MLMLEETPTLAAAPASLEGDRLFDLQLRVARRADELSGGQQSTRGRDLMLWLEAEREVCQPLIDAMRETVFAANARAEELSKES